MTVTYSAEVATSRGFGCFWKLLFRWRGSIYKLLWPDLALYFSFYYFLSILYRFALKEREKRFFEKMSLYCSTYADLIPVSFVLGFYVSLVVKRWWDSFNCIPWPDSLAFFVSAFIHGQDDRGRLMRRTIMRYVNLAFVITLTCISPCVKKRFPTMDHLVEAGILLPNEKNIIEQMKTSHSTYWMPLVWASSIATRARKEGRIRDDFALKTVVDALAHHRSLCGGLFNYDWISIPLVYTQVVTLVVYTFFLATLMGRQYLDPTQGYRGYEVDLYIPVFNFLQFFFYMGWLKVAETLVNPFGEDDDDFEVNWVIDRDIQVSYLIVDEMHQEHPELIKDQYWDEIMPDLPYTAAAKSFYTEPPQGSASALIVTGHEAEFVPLETLVEDSEDEQLDDVKVNGIHSIPLSTAANRNGLSRNLSESSQSSISGLGRSFHPHSQQRRSVMSLLHRLFSRDHGPLGSNISLHSAQSKAHRKRSSRDSNVSPSSNPSMPPSPVDFRGHLPGFTDDIFHLSDLSLAESRATSVAQSPGIFSNLQVTDIFGRLKPERPHRFPLQTQLSMPKPSTPVTPRAEASEDEVVKPQISIKRQRTNSLKHFFRPSGKYRGSQKSLLDNFQTDQTGKPHSPSMISVALDGSLNSSSVSEQKSEDSGNSVQTAILDQSENDNLTSSQNSVSHSDLGQRKPSIVSQISDKSRCSLPHILGSSPEEPDVGMTAKEPSTLTLVAGEDLQGNVSTPINLNNTERNTQNISLKKNPLFQRRSFAPSRIFSSLRPKRTVSLLIHDNSNFYSTTGSVRKFYNRKKHHDIIHTGSQPVSPTESEPPNFKLRFKSKRECSVKGQCETPKDETSSVTIVKQSKDRPEITVSSLGSSVQPTSGQSGRINDDRSSDV